MEDDLELRRYIRALLRGSWLIFLLALAAGAGGWVYAAQRAVSYQASALLAVSRPLFAADLEAVAQSLVVPVRTYGELAMSDAVVERLHAQLQSTGAQPPAPAALRGQLAASAAAETGLVRLTVTAAGSAEAAQIANAWAEVILAQSAALYGPGSAQMLGYRAQLETARAALEAARAAHSAYQSQNQAGLLQAELLHLQAQLTSALDRQTRYALLADNARGLQARLAAQDAAAPASTADEAALLLLTAQAAQAGLPAGGNTTDSEGGTSSAVSQPAPAPLNIQITLGGGASSQSVSGLSASVEIFIQDLGTRAEAAAGLAEALGPQLLQQQAAVAGAANAATPYAAAVTLAEAQYGLLAGLVSQAEIAAQDAAGLVRLASPATVPSEPSSNRQLTTAAVAAVAGLVLAVVLFVALEWWRTPLPRPRAAADNAAQGSAP